MMFNTSLKAAWLPKEWKETYVTPVHKKNSKEPASNYRPISLLCNCKLTRDFGTSTGFELMAVALALQCSTQWLIQGRGYCRITEAVWENQVFLKADHGLLCTSDLVYCFFELVSYSFQRESIKYMNSGRKSWL